MNKKFFIWEGVYSSFSEIPKIGKGYSSKVWLEKSFDRIKKTKMVNYRESLLPFLVAIVWSIKRTKKIRVLDYGGNLGRGYVLTSQALVNNSKYLDYHIIELKKLCQLGRKIYQKKENVFFHEILPAKFGRIDVVYFCSSLQYIENWKGLLEKLAGLKPKYFLFDDLPAGDIPTFATVQNYYGSKIPYWFFNIGEIIELLELLGYKLIFKSSFVATILGREQDLPQHNFLLKYRLGKSCSLLFTKDETTNKS